MTISNKTEPRIIGLTGTLASGKDTVAELLARKHGFLDVSTSDILRAKKKQVFGDGPQALLIRNDPFAFDLRVSKGAGVLVELAYEDYRKQKDRYPGGLVVSGIRSIGEAEKIKELGGTLVFVDADIRTRYERAVLRNRDTVDSSVSFADFAAMEASESPENSTDKAVINLLAIRDMADIHLENNGNGIEAFGQYVEEQLL